jgi:hypothetical protein
MDLKLNLKFFITSKAEYAMKAFDYDATDYQNRQSIGLTHL